MEFCLLFENHSQEEEAVSQRAGDHDGVQAGELVGNEIVVGDAVFVAKVLGIGASMERADRNDEAEAIGRCYFTAAPGLYKRDSILCGDQAGIRLGQGFVPNEVLVYPG